MHSSEPRSAFLERFDHLLKAMRRALIGQAVCWSLFLAGSGLLVLSAADFWGEMDRGARVVGLCVVVLLSLAVGVVQFVRAVRRSSRPRTATEIERCFPELGQSVRTSVQYSDLSGSDIGEEGVASTLVSALNVATEEQSRPLGIESIVPRRRFRIAVGLAGLVFVLLIGGTAVDWELRTATMRALLANQPHTELKVTPGDCVVDEGDSVKVSLELRGRTQRDVVLLTRSLGDDDVSWQEVELTAADVVSDEPHLRMYAVNVDSIQEPLEYRVIAGPARSEPFRVDVRRSLSIEAIEVNLTPPAYTLIGQSTVSEGDFSAIDGTRATFRITLDRSAESARMILSSHADSDASETVEKEMLLAVDGATLTASLDVTDDLTYSIVAKAADGMQTRENKYRIRVRKDRAPQVWIEEPREALEVHSLAEVLLRMRVRDDFGLVRAGIVFEVNNEEEYTLLERDFRQILEQAREAGEALRPQTFSALEELLPLEFFELTQKDSVTYYAFAEDNYPANSHVTETDLRFIDIRPFRRLYRIPEDGQGQGQGGPRIRFLGEIIARQRFNLNRTIRLSRRDDSPRVTEVDRIARYEDELARATHQLADFLVERAVDGSDLLFQAEAVMLTAVDSLSVGKYDVSVQQEKDALRLLIEGRTQLEVTLRQANNGQRRALQNFDRMQTQKLRRELQEDEDEQERDNLVERLRKLTDEERIVYATLRATTLDRGVSSEPSASENSNGKGPENPTQGPSETQDADEANAERTANAKGDNEKPESTDKAAGDGTQTSSILTRVELEEKQQEIALEAREIERIVQGLPAASALMRERAEAAADAAERSAGALSRGDGSTGSEEASRAGEMFQELALNVDGVLAENAVQKIAMSRDLSAGLARMERKLAQGLKLDNDKPQEKSGGGSRKNSENDSEEEADVAAQAARLAETGKTVGDILSSVGESNSRDDREAIRQVDELLAEGDVAETVERMTRIPGMVRTGSRRGAQLEAENVADELIATARRLDEIHRAIVNPRLEQLNALEKRAAKLEGALTELETIEKIGRWHRDAMALAEDLKAADAAVETQEELEKVAEGSGGSGAIAYREWKRSQADASKFVAPSRHKIVTRAVVEELQRQMQDTVLTDLVADEDEATPQRYKQLVDRYIQVLSSDVVDD